MRSMPRYVSYPHTVQIEDDDNNDDNDCPDDYDSAAEDRTMFKAKVVSNLSTFDCMEFFFFL